MSAEIDIANLRNWIGKQEEALASVTPELLERFRATLSGYTPFNDEAPSSMPLGIHWCLAQPAAPGADLGDDGHPARGVFLPPVPLPRRMWASSRVHFRHPIGLGTPISKLSTIADVTLKHNAACEPLVFVKVDHVFSDTADNVKRTLIEETQTLVYQQAPSGNKMQTSRSEPLQTPAQRLKITPDSTLLFRYSALTFNGHRIHYDHNYATREEGYPDLVVHGPLMATLLMNTAQTSRPQDPMQSFEFRGVKPVFVDRALQVCSLDTMGEYLEIRNHEGVLVMTAEASF